MIDIIVMSLDNNGCGLHSREILMTLLFPKRNFRIHNLAICKYLLGTFPIVSEQCKTRRMLIQSFQCKPPICTQRHKTVLDRI